MADSAAANTVDVIDPQVRVFVSRISEGFASHAGFDSMPHAQARDVAETVRRPWSVGGPVMAEVSERHVSGEVVGPDEAVGVRVRVYSPTTATAEGGNAALIYLHGGGWTLFSLDTHDRLMREYASRAGMVVVGVDYALSPEAKFPTALNQVVAVARWLRIHGEEIGVDPSRLAIGGDSAGGNMALAAALKLRDAGEGETLRALLLNYGAFDFECSPAADWAFGGEGFMLNGAEMRQYWTNYLNSPADAANPLACPAQADLHGLPPVMLVIAECDVLAEQNLVMADRLADAGVEVRATVYKGATHSFLEAVSVAPLADRALSESADWLRQTSAAT